jgi:hypothetical protein
MHLIIIIYSLEFTLRTMEVYLSIIENNVDFENMKYA